MKLQEGVYENVIDTELKKNIDEAQLAGLFCQEGDIDSAESPKMLSDYLGNILFKRLVDLREDPERQKELVNQLLEQISADAETEDSETEVLSTRQMLTAVHSPATQARIRATEQDIVRPQSGFRVSNLFTGGQSALPLSSEIQRDIASADRISLIVSFLKLSGLRLIIDDLRRFCSVEGHQLRVITTTYCGVTDAKAVQQLAELPNTEIRISYNTKIERLHAKSYIFERNSGLSTAYIGSSNLSKSAQTDGLEWNIRVTNVENPHIIKTALGTFEQYWNSQNFEDFRLGGIDKFYSEMNRERNTQRSTDGPTIAAVFNILPHQKSILDKLELERESGILRNLIVAATGTGKTVISAFDYRRFQQQHKGHDRLLFVAHREEILRQSRGTYRAVLQDYNFGDLWVGSEKPLNDFDHLFVSVATLNSRFDESFEPLPADYYDYIVIDEAHHAAADSYRRIFNHFKPKLLIGLTATPERMDGVSLLPDFDNCISAEIRLPQALDEGLLTPFQYLCISDTVTDLSDEELIQGGKYIDSKLSKKLCSEARCNLIMKSLHHYLPDEQQCKALCFCTDTEHASFMTQAFLRSGFKAACLTSANNQDRVTLNKDLASGRINYLFVVDMFNEGVDIPEVDTVLFLRPTASLTIFLQQLGRGLRLAPGKQLLTVMDFVSQLNQNYDYSSRFRALLTRTDEGLTQQIKDGFTLLPHGCSIMMEEKAQQFVLENIKAAIYNQRRLIRELQSYPHTPTLSEFLLQNGQDIRLLYKGSGNCWTSLKRAAGKSQYDDDAMTKRLSRNIGNLAHINSRRYLQFVQNWSQGTGKLAPKNACEQTYALMLYYDLFQEKLTTTSYTDIYEALETVALYPLFMQEIAEMSQYLLNNLTTKTFSIGQGLPDVVEQYSCYSREEIFTLMGVQTAQKRMQGSVAGVFNVEKLNTEIFFVTLNKSDREFSASTLYDDYVMGPRKFHWQSQNDDAHNNKGKRFVEQKNNGKKFLLFVRQSKKDGFGNTCPFYCFGLINYVRSSGDRPMNIEWSLEQEIMPSFLKSV